MGEISDTELLLKVNRLMLIIRRLKEIHMDQQHCSIRPTRPVFGFEKNDREIKILFEKAEAIFIASEEDGLRKAIEDL